MLFFMSPRFDLFQCHVALFTEVDVFRILLLLLLLILMPMVTVMIFFIADLDCKKNTLVPGQHCSIVKCIGIELLGFQEKFVSILTSSDIRVLAIQALRKDTQQPPTIALRRSFQKLLLFSHVFQASSFQSRIPKCFDRIKLCCC